MEIFNFQTPQRIICEQNEKENKQFFAELNVYMKDKYHEIYVQIKHMPELVGITFMISPQQLLEDYKLQNISFLFECKGNVIIPKYLYKDYYIEVIHYPIEYLPNPCYNVSLLQALRECCRQKTHAPNIKFLEDGTFLRFN